MSEPFIAQITMFGGNFAPRGWAFCDGQLLAISQNTADDSLGGAYSVVLIGNAYRCGAPLQTGR